MASLLTGVRARWTAGEPTASPTLYFANHTSHGDFVLVWAALPPTLRRMTRPVARADYWLRSALRRFIGRDVFRALLVHSGAGMAHESVELMVQALSKGESLVVFPEGTRNTTDDDLLPFKSGLFHVAMSSPGAQLVPVWIENLRRVLPKGGVLPVPLACTVHFGAPIVCVPGESKVDFLARAQAAVLALRPEHARDNAPSVIQANHP
ncbi:MAG: lysophospholipid acyltransferase family protein [Hydrogenophaga sp.]